MKTGTVSCAEALRILGYSVAHFNELRRELEETGGWLSGDFETDWLAKYDTALDNPIPAIYPQLDHRYPNSQFILTVRDKDKWLESCRKYLAKVPAAYEYRKLVRTAVYGMYDFNQKQWKYIHKKHIAEVRTYFKDRQEDLLELNICDNASWNTLCSFLDKPIPDRDFPKLNVFPDYVFE